MSKDAHWPHILLEIVFYSVINSDVNANWSESIDHIDLLKVKLHGYCCYAVIQEDAVTGN